MNFRHLVSITIFYGQITFRSLNRRTLLSTRDSILSSVWLWLLWHITKLSDSFKMLFFSPYRTKKTLQINFVSNANCVENWTRATLHYFFEYKVNAFKETTKWKSFAYISNYLTKLYIYIWVDGYIYGR